MTSQRPRRKTIRYPGYDYGQPGTLFVTICTYDRQPLFGSVQRGSMHLSQQGEIVESLWHEIPDRFPGVILDATVVMPDHLHGILFLATDPEQPSEELPTLADIVRSFKRRVQIVWRDRVQSGTWAAYKSHLWQRGYYDRIVRNDRELEQIRAYIEGNPARWQERHEER